MVAMSGLTLAMATILGNQQQSLAAIRETPMQPILAFGWTLLQIPIFWGTFLPLDSPQRCPGSRVDRGNATF